MDEVFHYPPELTQLLVDTIPLICRSKQDVLLFFRGAGVSDALCRDLSEQLTRDPRTVNKYQITRTIIGRVNEMGDRTLRERREILRRVVEFEDFSTAWPDDQLKAKGLVAEIRRVINVKDSFTRINQDREAERQDRVRQAMLQAEATRRKREELDRIKAEFAGLFSYTDAQLRGRRLESVLNQLFRAHDISVRESFSVRTEDGRYAAEQIDGVVELDGHLYLVEMKWWQQPLGVPEVSQHLVRIYHRGQSRGLLISGRATPILPWQFAGRRSRKPSSCCVVLRRSLASWSRMTT